MTVAELSKLPVLPDVPKGWRKLRNAPPVEGCIAICNGLRKDDSQYKAALVSMDA